MEEKDLKRAYLFELLTAGLAIGALSALQFVMVYLFKDIDSKIINWAINIYGFGVIVWCLMYYGRRAAAIKDQNGVGYSFGSAFAFALTALLLSGIITGIGQWIMQNVVDPEYYREALRKALELTTQSTPNISEDQLEAIRSTQKIMNSIWGVIGANIMGMGIMGGLIALATSTFVKRKPNIFSE